jgi:acetyl-CoA carboxylase alpha subunit
MFVGQERRHVAHVSQIGERQTAPHPEGYRKAIRLMDLAARLHCPLVTFVDTSGADPGDESERHGIATISSLRNSHNKIALEEGLHLTGI